MIARARPTSAAAMVITKTAKMMPVNCCGERYTAKAMKLILTACSISSTDIKMSTALRRASTPYIPSEKRIVLSTRKRSIGIMSRASRSFAFFSSGEDDRADQRHHQDEGGDLKRHSPVAIEHVPDVVEGDDVDLVRLPRP